MKDKTIKLQKDLNKKSEKFFEINSINPNDRTESINDLLTQWGGSTFEASQWLLGDKESNKSLEIVVHQKDKSQKRGSKATFEMTKAQLIIFRDFLISMDLGDREKDY